MTFDESKINRERDGKFGQTARSSPGQLDLDVTEQPELPAHLMRQAQRLHPNASDAELREVAEKLYDVQISLTGEPRDVSPGTSHYTGGKYQGYMRVAEVSKNVRNGIKVAKKAGLIDPSIEISVTSRDGVVNISVKAEDVSRFWRIGIKSGRVTWVRSDEAKDLELLLQRMSNAYNYDRSDVMTDLFITNHYTRVDFPTEYSAAYDAYKANSTPETRAALEKAMLRSSKEWLEAHWDGVTY